MYKLDADKREQIIGALVEGTSIRAVSRMTGASRNTIARLLLNALNDRPSDGVVFVPFQLGDIRHALAVALTQINVSDGSLTVTLEPLTSAEQAALLTRIKAPYKQENASAN